ncbi:MAG: hypothetical protein HUU20_28385 [Pirellulales bacterium]|nr:hypothetical protein [Pirellulales bacterium]
MGQADREKTRVYECLCGNRIVYQIEALPGTAGSQERIVHMQAADGAELVRCPRCGQEVSPPPKAQR